MAWSWQEKGPVLDKENGLYLMKSPPPGRDNFWYSIKEIDTDKTVFSFECQSIGGEFFTDQEKLKYPGYGGWAHYLVARHTLTEEQMAIIEEALCASRNRHGGFGLFKDGIPSKALVTVKYVQYLEGY
ncbi:hypothetical protein MRBLMA1_002436 [Sphingobium sp. LMA1-1-1.1]|uniref:hypothetical protein n=1 Tax=Sphingobium sp. LMA1-1-1.1 TaxID=3135238 RepID=UPI00342BFD70